jgi:DNA-binding response OmpR family regulator
MRVLVVEDDKALGLFLQKGLMLEGHEVDWVGDGVAALENAEARQPDLMVLDLGLPGMDGVEVLAQFRAKYKDVSVLVLTGRSDVEERIRCLRAGADDCVIKPFSFHELVARCTGILGRRQQYSDPVLRHGEIEMNRISRCVQRNGYVILLTTKEFALLEFMLLRRGGSCSRAELLREVWQMAPEASTNIVDVYINYLRKKLAAAHGDGERCSAAIETVRGTGYRLSGEAVSIAHAAEPEAEVAAAIENVAVA